MRISKGNGKYIVWLEQHNIGSDILFILGGGEKTHIGGIVIGEPGKPPEIHSLGNHYDHHVLSLIVEAAQKKYNTTIISVGGIHIDNATKQEINTLINNCQLLANQISK
jgi:hypothetical protein